jgi:hypothetical protein
MVDEPVKAASAIVVALVLVKMLYNTIKSGSFRLFNATAKDGSISLFKVEHPMQHLVVGNLVEVFTQRHRRQLRPEIELRQLICRPVLKQRGDGLPFF